jgi:sec-independent protein translocase protein TatA
MDGEWAAVECRLMRAFLRPASFLLALSVLLPSCSVGGPEIAIIALVVLLLFGGSRLPKLMRGMGSGVHEFKKGLKEGERPPDDEDEALAKKKRGDGSDA